MSPRLLAILVLAALVLPASARADEAPPPEDLVCGTRKAGDACDYRGGPGTCVASQCSRLDYSKGVPPAVVSHDCLRCQLAAPPASPAPASPAPAAPTPDPAASQPEKATSGCRVAPGAPPAPLLLLLLAPLLRRRRNSPWAAGSDSLDEGRRAPGRPRPRRSTKIVRDIGGQLADQRTITGDEGTFVDTRDL